MNTLDCRAHKCPQPVVETRKKLLSAPGEPLTVLVGDATARENVSRMARSQGYGVKESTTEGGFALELSPGAPPGSTTEAPAEGKTVVYIGSDQMGSGDPELGRILLKNFIFTLTEAEQTVDTIFFVNAGVKLACRGSELIEALEKLACLGADIASCGLCLEFYGLKERLAVGRSSNMLEIVEGLQKAGRILRP